MEVLWFLIDNWKLVLAIAAFCFLMWKLAEMDMDGVSKAIKKSEKLRKKLEKELDD